MFSVSSSTGPVSLCQWSLLSFLWQACHSHPCSSPLYQKVKVLVTQSCPTLCDPITAAHQAALSMGFSRQGYWSGVPFLSPGDLSDPGIEPRSLALQGESLPTELPGSPRKSGSESHSVVSDSLWRHGLHSPWNSPGQSTGVGSHSFLQGNFPIQGLNPGFPQKPRSYSRLHILISLSPEEERPSPVIAPKEPWGSSLPRKLQ